MSVVGEVIGTIFGGSQQRKANQLQRQSMEMQRQMNDLQAGRQKREAIRAARIARAQSAQAAENQGVALSSVAQGAVGSIMSQLGDNLSFLDQYNTLADRAMQYDIMAQKRIAKARTAADLVAASQGVRAAMSSSGGGKGG